ncbi:hypothetical protein ACFSKU_16205 [Pontibacter silvestris]|uniref:Uncharacterized protein n=1 Tax=Pontibacter silvestris TaxID=2305183 RepID=A0ABW4X0H6_9BACT|nr:hypothetical protein [Pontibacter silvestris]MCC9136014.1 hypothetical protein [Pontibacter silvestris]
MATKAFPVKMILFFYQKDKLKNVILLLLNKIHFLLYQFSTEDNNQVIQTLFFDNSQPELRVFFVRLTIVSFI